MISISAGMISISGTSGIPSWRVRQVVTAVLDDADRVAEISVTFLGLEAMRHLNLEHLDRDSFTDVIAFELLQPDGGLVGDIYVCPGVAARQARMRGIRRQEEVERLLVHGTLHVLGHQHPEEDDREESEMWKRQERLLRELQ